MKRSFTIMCESGLALTATLLLTASLALAQSGSQARVIQATKYDKSPPLHELAKNIPPPQPGEPREVPLRPSPVGRSATAGVPQGRDPALQSQPGALGAAQPIQNFDGVSNQDNVDILGFFVVPPDINMDVGPNHVVQMVNLLFAIWDKGGNLLLGPLPNSALWDGFGGPCENDNGDPIVLYDHLADRWILSQLTFVSMCYAVSETGDPTGAYFRYEFPFGGLPDYPKLGVWPDAYYATYRSFAAGFDMLAAALERDAMLEGAPAQIVLFSITDMFADVDGVLPADLDGAAPPAGTPGFFIGHQDAQDRLFLFELSVDWDNPANSTLDGPFFLPVDPFDAVLCGDPFFGNCVPQPSPGVLLSTLPFAMMHRLAFRNFGSYMAMVANHTVDVDGNNHVGIRWYELRDAGGGWSIYQQGTYAPDSEHRWMGSIAMDGSGNIALGYTISSSATYPSIRFAGHTITGPLGVMDVAEETLIAGSGAQTGGGSRWGDYSMVTVDPSDDVTFWMTHEYYAVTSSSNWRTRIGSFMLEVEPIPGPHILVSPNPLQFGDVQYGEEETRPLLVRAIGTEEVTIADITIDHPDFTAAPTSFTLPPGEAQIVDVTFVPGQLGPVEAILTVFSSDADEPEIYITLLGVGGGTLGDLNGDGERNIFDIITLINLVLNKEYHLLGDMNEDGALDILDIIILIDVALAGGAA